MALAVGLEDQFLAGVPAPGPDGLDGDGEGVALAACEQKRERVLRSEDFRRARGLVWTESL